MLLRRLRQSVPLSPPLPTPLYLLLASLLATLLVLTLRSEAGEQQRRRRQRRPSGGLAARMPSPLLDFMSARLQLWAGGLTLLGQLLAMGSKSELQVSGSDGLLGNLHSACRRLPPHAQVPRKLAT